MPLRGKTIAHTHIHNRHNKPKVHYESDDRFQMWVVLVLFAAFLVGLAALIF